MVSNSSWLENSPVQPTVLHLTLPVLWQCTVAANALLQKNRKPCVDSKKVSLPLQTGKHPLPQHSVAPDYWYVWEGAPL